MLDFGVGYSEILLIAVVALIVLGPEDFPKLFYRAGNFLRQFRQILSGFRRQMEEISQTSGFSEIKNDFSKFSEDVSSLRGEVEKLASPQEAMRQALEKEGDDISRLLDQHKIMEDHLRLGQGPLNEGDLLEAKPKKQQNQGQCVSSKEQKILEEKEQNVGDP